MDQNTALVTGATGFIGKHLCQQLIKEGWDVHVILRPTSDIESLKKFLNGNCTCHIYNGENQDIVDIVAAVQPIVVFHLASLFLAQHTFDDIMPLIQSNVIFSTQLVEAMIQNRIYSLVNTGTSWQHYNNAPYNPVCLYAATKQAFEDILKYYQETTKLQVITLKLFDTYGSGDTRPKLLNLLNRIAASGELLEMSPGEQYIDLVHIEDVASAFIMAAKYLLGNRTDYAGDYAITSGKVIKLKDLVQIYETVIGQKLNIKWGGRTYRAREVMQPWNNGRLLPGWTPKIKLEDGLRNIMRK